MTMVAQKNASFFAENFNNFAMCFEEKNSGERICDSCAGK
jgi:hypothetical protein